MDLGYYLDKLYKNNLVSKCSLSDNLKIKLDLKGTASVKLTTTNFSFQPSKSIQSAQRKNDFLQNFHTKVKNSADMTDTIVVPRTIFKGYLGIMTGTTLATLGTLVNKKLPKVSKTLSVSGLLLSLYGTFSFVRPYVIKNAKGVETKK